MGQDNCTGALQVYIPKQRGQGSAMGPVRMACICHVPENLLHLPQSGWELSGISGTAENMVLDPAEALLFSEPELLDRLRNATLVQVLAVLAPILSSFLRCADLCGTPQEQ